VLKQLIPLKIDKINIGQTRRCCMIITQISMALETAVLGYVKRFILLTFVILNVFLGYRGL